MMVKKLKGVRKVEDDSMGARDGGKSTVCFIENGARWTLVGDAVEEMRLEGADGGARERGYVV